MKKEKIDFVDPIRKGICTECKKPMVNFHGEYYCIKCGNKIKYAK